MRHGTLAPDHPPLAIAPRGEMTACEQVPHSDRRPCEGDMRTLFTHSYLTPGKVRSPEPATIGPPLGFMRPKRSHTHTHRHTNTKIMFCSRRGPYINRAPIRDSRATRRAPVGDYMLRAALVVKDFCPGENQHAHPNGPFSGYIVQL